MSGSGPTLAPDERCRYLVVGHDARATRRALDPTAWMLLEELALSSEGHLDSERMVATTSVRDLAACVGLSKDTVAAALRRLAKAGLVIRQEERDGASGRFGRSYYVVDVAATGMRLTERAHEPHPTLSDTATTTGDVSHSTAAASRSSRKAPRPGSRSRRAVASTQLSLLDAEAHSA